MEADVTNEPLLINSPALCHNQVQLNCKIIHLHEHDCHRHKNDGTKSQIAGQVFKCNIYFGAFSTAD